MVEDVIRNRLLAVITVLLVVAGLRASYAVTMPLAAAIVIIAAIWPIKPWLDRALPSKAMDQKKEREAPPFGGVRKGR